MSLYGFNRMCFREYLLPRAFDNQTSYPALANKYAEIVCKISTNYLTSNIFRNLPKPLCGPANKKSIDEPPKPCSIITGFFCLIESFLLGGIRCICKM